MFPVVDDGEFLGYDVFEGDDLKLAYGHDYFIYMSNVNLRKDGTIDGRYLGVAGDILIDGYARDATYIEKEGYQVEGKQIRTARMVVIKNEGKKRVIIIIE